MIDPTWRSRFPILQTKTYLASHTLGAMPDTVRDELAEYTDLWAREGVEAWDTWLPMVAETAAILEDLIGAPRGTMTMTQNATNSLAMVLSCFDFHGTRNRIVYCAGDFPTVEYLLHGQRVYGAEVVRVGTDPLVFPEEELIAAIDERTLLVVISHVLFRTAEIVNIAAIVERARAVGATVVLDAYQSMGAVPFDVRELGVDFLIGGSVKWLCGGPGAGYLYAREDLLPRIEPVLTGWLSHERPFAFEPPPIVYAAGAARFIGGTPNIPAYYQARAGYRIVSDVGVAAIREQARRQTAILADGARDLGFTVNSPEAFEHRGSHITIDWPGAEAAKYELIRRGFTVDYRPGAGIRVGPHFYNTDDECRAILAEMVAIRDGR